MKKVTEAVLMNLSKAFYQSVKYYLMAKLLEILRPHIFLAFLLFI